MAVAGYRTGVDLCSPSFLVMGNGSVWHRRTEFLGFGCNSDFDLVHDAWARAISICIHAAEYFVSADSALHRHGLAVVPSRGHVGGSAYSRIIPQCEWQPDQCSGTGETAYCTRPSRRSRTALGFGSG